MGNNLCLILVLPLVNSSPVVWREWGHNGLESGVLHDTGYSHELLAYIWHRKKIQAEVARLVLLAPFDLYKSSPYYYGPETIVALCFYAALWYIHFYPSAVAFGQRDWRHFGRMSTNNFYDMVCLVLTTFSTAMDEIHYNDRLHPKNHGSGIFEKYVTCFVDTVPIYVSEPKDKQLSDLLMQPKYGGHVYKLQVAINFLGWIVYYSGPHYGTEADNTIFEETMHEHWMYSWEFWCGDGIYNR